ncbi:LysR family transcriptional regulator [Aeromicrobium flavum]|uniref:LysR family transcriptional regulator n=1 Tax=Aeromicrobium flavum TaxID=416568 RepID=A0A512HRN0_9ACTN|nr:LysR family transcriptional regulator [Aeromicrobium flavum]GEO88086.1 LysR family transcriptional regulator [Aeromicrobium flavum]
MELGQLRVLRELGDRGSIAAVATALHVSPSAISQQISALQRRSPVPLTYRNGRRTALTDAGRALAAAAIDVEVALERAEQAVARFQDDRSGTVSVAAFHSAGLAIFAPLIMALSDPDQPDVTVTDFDVAQEDFPSLTTDHDLVLAHRLVGSPDWPPSMRVERLVFEPLDVVLRRDHPLAAKASLEPADLAGERWVAVHEGFPLEQAIALIAGLGGNEVRIEHRINEFQVAAAVVSASDCVALMPRYTSDLRSHPDLVLRPLAHPGVGRHIDCLARPETLERATVQTVLAHIRSITTDLTAVR